LGSATVAFVVAAILVEIAVEILRSIVDRRRRERTGFGGTQDIAIWGIIINLLLILGALISGTIWLMTR